MTREAFIEAVVEQAHRAWLYYEQGESVDMVLLLGHVHKETGDERDPSVSLTLRGKLGRNVGR